MSREGELMDLFRHEPGQVSFTKRGRVRSSAYWWPRVVRGPIRPMLGNLGEFRVEVGFGFRIPAMLGNLLLRRAKRQNAKSAGDQPIREPK